MGKTFKSLLIVALVILASESFGQGKIGVTGMGGASLQKLERDSGNDDILTKFVYKVGAVYDYSVTDHWSVNTALQFSHQAYEEDFEGEPDDFTRSYNYLQVPLNVAYRVNFSETENIIFQAGGYMAYAINSKKENNEFGKQDVTFGEDDRRRFDGGVQFGIGTEYNDFRLMFYYDLGLYDFNHTTTRVEKNRGLSVALTYYIWK